MDRGRGLTGLELLILIAVGAAAVAAGLALEEYQGGAKAPSGIIPLSLETAERTMVVAGETYGFWVRDGTAGGIPVSFPQDPRPGVDAISVPIQLLVGQDPIDMNSLRVAVRSRDGTTVLLRDESGRPGRSSWAVTGKTGVLPLQEADRDDLLETPETFQVLVLPPGPLEPGEQVTVTISSPPGIPLVIDRDIPARVSPVTLLSL
jgi:archaellin